MLHCPQIWKTNMKIEQSYVIKTIFTSCMLVKLNSKLTKKTSKSQKMFKIFTIWTRQNFCSDGVHLNLLPALIFKTGKLRTNFTELSLQDVHDVQVRAFAWPFVLSNKIMTPVWGVARPTVFRSLPLQFSGAFSRDTSLDQSFGLQKNKSVFPLHEAAVYTFGKTFAFFFSGTAMSLFQNMATKVKIAIL